MNLLKCYIIDLFKNEQLGRIYIIVELFPTSIFSFSKNNLDRNSLLKDFSNTLIFSVILWSSNSVVEYLPFKQRVDGSSPSWITILYDPFV